MILHTNTGGLGDELMLTAWVRGYKRACPDEMIRLGNHRREVWRLNPWINKGNHDNGLVLNPLGECCVPGLNHFPRGYARDHGFELTDPTPEIFLAPHELDVAWWPADGRPVAAIDPGCGWASREWPGSRWQDVASSLLDAGWIVLELGVTSKVRAEERPRLPHTWSFVDRHSVRQTASVLAQCDVLLGHDSGLMHLAAAVGTPQVALFGPVHSRYRAYATTEALDAPCNPRCSARPGPACALTATGRSQCLTEVTPAQVLAAVDRARARRVR